MLLHESFAQLKNLLSENDPGVAEEIFERYVSRLIRLVAPRLVGAIRRKVDPEDVVQSALGSFFRGNQERAFDIESWESLWALLATLTLRKCRFKVRELMTAKRLVSLEEYPGEGGLGELGSLEPSPFEVASCADLVRSLLAGLPEKSRLIGELALLGHSAGEIATEAGLTERTVYRQMERLRSRLGELANETSELVDPDDTQTETDGKKPGHATDLPAPS